jgi:hypothetical protein
MWFNTVFTYAVIIQHERFYDTVGTIFPNGDRISDETLEVLKEVMDEAEVSFKWQHTDVIMIDNRTVQHAREYFCVPPRRILVALFKDHQGPI